MRDRVLVSDPRLLRAVTTAAQNGPEVYQMVLDVLATILRYQDVHSIDLGGVVVIHPGAENGQTAQHSTVFMRDRVVWIVTPGAAIVERSYHLAIEPAAGQRTVGAVGQLRLRLQKFVDHMLGEGNLLPARIAVNYAVGSLQLPAAEVDDVVFRCAVTEGVE